MGKLASVITAGFHMLAAYFTLGFPVFRAFSFSTLNSLAETKS